MFAAFVAVSGITLNGYTQTIDFNGGIYGGGNTFGLSSNTVIGFAFVLAMAIVLSYAYIWLARLFTKQFIWITGILNIVWGFATAIYMWVVAQKANGAQEANIESGYRDDTGQEASSFFFLRSFLSFASSPGSRGYPSRC